MSKTNTIEERLLAKELERVQAEIARGMTIINKALYELPVAHTSAEKEEEQRWILEMFQGDSKYSSQGWKHQVAMPIVTNFPLSMRKRILKQVVEVFLDEVEAMQEITNNLE